MADHDIIRSLIRTMKIEIAQVRCNVVRCSTIQQPSRSSVCCQEQHDWLVVARVWRDDIPKCFEDEVSRIVD